MVIYNPQATRMAPPGADLAALDCTQLRRVDHQRLTLPRSLAHKCEALGVVGRTVVVAAHKKCAIANVVASPGNAAVPCLPTRLALIWRPVLPLPCQTAQRGSSGRIGTWGTGRGLP